MDWIWIWVAVVAVSLVVEFTTMEMVSLWTAIGGIIALVLAALDVCVEAQLIVFFIISIVLVLTLRKVALKYLLKNSDTKTGTDRIVGNSYKLITSITDDEPGTLKVNDIIWWAKSKDGAPISAGNVVEVVELKGNKLIVKIKEDKK